MAKQDLFSKENDSILGAINKMIGKPVIVKEFYDVPYAGTFLGVDQKTGKAKIEWEEGGEELIPLPFVSMSEGFAEPLEEVQARIERKFVTLDKMARGCIDNRLNGIIVSGPGGLGKTYTVEAALTELRGGLAAEHDVDVITGHITHLGLYERLYQNSQEGKVTVFDDADSVFDSDKTLNMLKAALDSKPHRILHFDSRSKLLSAPPSFVFKGNIIFLTNKVLGGAHYDAFLTRVHHVDMHMNNREIMVRIQQVAEHVDHRDATPEQKAQVLSWMNDHVNELKGVLSIRSFIKLLDLYLLEDGDMEAFNDFAMAQLID